MHEVMALLLEHGADVDAKDSVVRVCCACQETVPVCRTTMTGLPYVRFQSHEVLLN